MTSPTPTIPLTFCCKGMIGPTTFFTINNNTYWIYI